MPLYLKLSLGALFLAYPFIIYFGLLNFTLWQIALVVAILAGLRAFAFKSSNSQLAKIGFYGSLVLIFFAILSMLLNQNGWLKLYPIIISLMSFIVFFSSLFSDKSMIQRFAEIREKDIDETKQLYMRQLTMIWCVFFVVNASVSAYTMFFLSFKQWTLYNGLVSYMIMGLLVIIELSYRYLVVKRR